MTDLVKWLRALEAQGAEPDDFSVLGQLPKKAKEAADEIERLRLAIGGHVDQAAIKRDIISRLDAEIERLRADLVKASHPDLAKASPNGGNSIIAARRIIAWRGPGYGYGTTDDALALATDAIAVAHALLSHKAEADRRFGQPNFGHGSELGEGGRE